MQERWEYRAEIAGQAIVERHASSVWGAPRTELAVVAWPSRRNDRLFVHWHYWWQAHYLNACIESFDRKSVKVRSKQIRHILRGMRVRNMRPLVKNRYYDDKAWLALALQSLQEHPKLPQASKLLRTLELNLFDGFDPIVGAIPWRTGSHFFNTPTNGPIAIIAAQADRLELAERLTNFLFEECTLPNGLIADGVEYSVKGKQLNTRVFSYCQGVALAAALETALLQRKRAGVAADDPDSQVGVENFLRVQELLEAISKNLVDGHGVINEKSGGGDGGLFKGILVRYLALVAEKLPAISAEARSARRTAKRIVLASAQSLWRNRLEVDGLPIFPATWTQDCMLPQSGVRRAKKRKGAVHGSGIPERDLSVQLSGWIALESASKVSRLEDV